MIYVSSDWHGVPLSRILRLLEMAHFGTEDYLFVLGDVIDRGQSSVELLKWLLVQPNVELLRGNHEAMLLDCDFLFEQITPETLDDLNAIKMERLEIWRSNGGGATISALSKEPPEMRQDILEYLRDTPLYDSVSVGGKDYFLVHGGLGEFEEGKSLSSCTEHDFLWSRPYLDTVYSTQFTTILGHTPTGYYGYAYSGRMIKTPTWWDIDTGAAGGGNPMLLCLDSGAEFYLPVDER